VGATQRRVAEDDHGTGIIRLTGPPCPEIVQLALSGQAVQFFWDRWHGLASRLVSRRKSCLERSATCTPRSAQSPWHCSKAIRSEVPGGHLVQNRYCLGGRTGRRWQSPRPRAPRDVQRCFAHAGRVSPRLATLKTAPIEHAQALGPAGTAVAGANPPLPCRSRVRGYGAGCRP
jgi:hypothetical protein